MKKSIYKVSPEQSAQVEVIKRMVAEDFGFTAAHLDSRSRGGELPKVRHVAMAIAYEITGIGAPEVAKAFNCTNHTTVYHAISVNRDRVASYPKFARQYKAVNKKIRKELKIA